MMMLRAVFSNLVLILVSSHLSLVQGQVIDTLCVNSTVGHYTVNGGKESTFLWEAKGGTVISPNGKSSVTIEWQNAAGIYELKVVETSRYGCVGDTIFGYVVIEDDPILFVMGPDTICKGEVVELLAWGQQNYLWTNGRRGPVLIDKPTETTTYAVTGTTKCESDTVYHTITVAPRPDADFYFVPAMPYTNDKVEFMYKGEKGPETYQWWLNNNLLVSQSTTASYVFTEEGRQEMQFIIANSFGCSDTAIKTINVSELHAFWVPNAFTPNSDGLNDAFLAKGKDIYKFRMQIYNRWGNLIFESDDIRRGWDGTSNGEECPQGVYDYVIHYEGEANVIQEREGYKNGQVTLIR